MESKDDYSFILQIVTTFYQRATNDFMIGYHFRKISDFESHLPRIADFWEYQLLGTEKMTNQGSLPFDLMGVHIPLKIKRGEVGRWVTLFQAVLDEKQIEHKSKRELIEQWQQKLHLFKDQFLKNPKLF